MGLVDPMVGVDSGGGSRSCEVREEEGRSSANEQKGDVQVGWWKKRETLMSGSHLSC